MRLVFVALVVLLHASPAHAVNCDGSELLCVDLTAASQVTSNGGDVVGGSFSSAGFAPSNAGGIDFDFASSVDLSVGAIEFDIEGLLPLPGGELNGGKVSLFSICGAAPEGASTNLGIAISPALRGTGRARRWSWPARRPPR